MLKKQGIKFRMKKNHNVLQIRLNKQYFNAKAHNELGVE